MIFILLDEVESILTEREITLSKANPVDAFRGVNEVIKNLDELATKFQKTFFLATSNLVNAVDKAFVDRTDRIFFVDFPTYNARFQILREVFITVNSAFNSRLDVCDREFPKLVYITQGLSGRQLRKLIIETISSSDSLSVDPSRIQINDLIKAVMNLKKSYAEWTSANQRGFTHGGNSFGG